MKKLILGAATAAALIVPASAGAHAVVSPVQPQGKALTSARTAYVLRVPNERADLDTYRVSLFVPAPIQTAISVKKLAGWDIRLAKKDTGNKNAEGAPVLAIEKITWSARHGSEINPLFFEEFPIRFQNPATAQKMCFWIHQFYGKPAEEAAAARKARIAHWTKVETVKWTGPEGSATPASCVSFVTA